MRYDTCTEELNYALQEHGVNVLNLRTLQLECHPAYTERGRLFITDDDGRVQDEVCEVNIEHPVVYSVLRQLTAHVRKSDLRKDPALYRWFASLDGRSADSRWGPADLYTTRQLKEMGLL